MQQNNRYHKGRNATNLSLKVLFACSFTVGLVSSARGNAALGESETHRARVSVESFESQSGHLSDEDISELLRIADNARVNDATRGRAFRLALNGASSPQARQSVVELLRLYPLFEKSTPQRKGVLGTSYTREFLKVADEYLIALPPEGLKTTAYILAHCSNELGFVERAIQIIKASPDDARNQCILAVARMAGRSEFPQELEPYIDDELTASMREQALKHIKAGRIYKQGVLYLTSVGDKSLLKSLRAAHAAQTDMLRKTYLDKLTWRIEVQESTDKLIDYLRLTPDDWETVHRQEFAMNKAIQKGATKSQVVAAIANQQRAAVPGSFSERALTTLKERAIRAKIMTAADLPEIKVRSQIAQPEP